MKHVEMIRAFVKTLLSSDTFHALVVESRPGWGKSKTVDLALSELGVKAIHAGSYATPLHIYNVICRNPKKLIILDDCYGVFNEPKAMAILKSATWGSGPQDVSLKTLKQKGRRVTWGSTSEKVEKPVVDFSGKLILLTNVVAQGKETEAFLSRCLSYRIDFNQNEIKRMLLSAAESKDYFERPKVAMEVARFLNEGARGIDVSKLNLRTLKLGYDLAITHAEGWRDFLIQLLPKSSEPKDSILAIIQSGLPVKDQESKFLAQTGKSRRTFYNYRKKFGASRGYNFGATK